MGWFLMTKGGMGRRWRVPRLAGSVGLSVARLGRGRRVPLIRGFRWRAGCIPGGRRTWRDGRGRRGVGRHRRTR